ncbi:MAG: hypothetical protein ACK5LR_12215 [Mangrovibacterium sp.]
MDTIGTMSIVELDEHKIRITLSPSKPHVLIKIILFLLGSFCVLFPLSILFIPQISVGFGYFTITLIIFGGSSIFFLRKLLWNFYGEEVFEISKSELLRYVDYKFFKENSNAMFFRKIQVGYAMLDKPNQVVVYPDEFTPDEKVFLGLVLDGEAIRSEVLIHSMDIKHLVEALRGLLKINYLGFK